MEIFRLIRRRATPEQNTYSGASTCSTGLHYVSLLQHNHPKRDDYYSSNQLRIKSSRCTHES